MIMDYIMGSLSHVLFPGRLACGLQQSSGSAGGLRTKKPGRSFKLQNG